MEFFTLLILCGGVWWAVNVLRKKKPQSSQISKKFIKNNEQCLEECTNKEIYLFDLNESEVQIIEMPYEDVAEEYSREEVGYLDDLPENKDEALDEEPMRYLPDGTPIETVHIQAEREKEIKRPMPFIQDIKSAGFSVSSAPKPRIRPSEIKGRQKKLLDYLNREELSNKEIGDRYERYIGYLYERAGWNVYYNGLIHGTADGGIDLICYSKNETHLVQAKRWNRKNQIDPNHIIDFVSNFEYFAAIKNISKAKAVFITTSSLAEEAKEFSAAQDILVLEHFPIKPHPVIKCITGTRGGRKYLLPYMDKKTPQRLHDETHGAWEPYDMASVNFHNGDCYVYTISQAEEIGYRYSNK